MSIKISLPNGQQREFESGLSVFEIAKQIRPSFAKEALSAVVNGVERDLSYVINEDCTLSIETFATPTGKHTFWHSSTHIMAQAICRLWPDAKLGTGPALENGFYYDIDLEHKISEEDFPKIEAEVEKIVKEAFEIERLDLSKEEVIQILKDRNQTYKLELIEKWGEEAVLSLYKQGEFIDLCTGPHFPNTKYMKAFKVLSVAGAYWQANANNKMLQRIYGISFEKKKELEEYLQMLEEAKQRDHRKIGKEQNIFMLSSHVGAGLPFWLPKGATIRRVIERYIVDKEIEVGYEHVYTPIMANVDLYKTSGHWDHYQDGMFPPMDMGDGELLVLRPMNCPHHMEVYNNEVHSYREFPIRIAELGMMHRYEMSGTLSGLQRVREMTLNDAHIFVRPDQIQEEFTRVLNLMLAVYKDFNINNYRFRLSYRDPQNKEKYFDDDNMWNNAEKMLKKAMDDLGFEYYEAIGEAAFYGPKLDVQVKTAIGMEETLSTIQLDFLLPERFDLTYVGEDGKNTHRPVVIHRGVISTMERFIAYLIEEYKGAFPTWLAADQVKVLAISDKYNDYAYELKSIFSKHGLRVAVDDRAEKIGYKIREAQLEKVPYMIVVGEQEAQNSIVSVRKRGVGDLGQMGIDEFLSKILLEVQNRVFE